MTRKSKNDSALTGEVKIKNAYKSLSGPFAIKENGDLNHHLTNFNFAYTAKRQPVLDRSAFNTIQ